MRVMCLAVLLLSGCDKLFPELAGTPPPDMAGVGDLGDGGVAPVLRIGGQVCALADLRDYRTCSPRGGTFRITVEETRDATMTDTLGRFNLPLSARIETATLAAVDVTGTFAPSIVPLRLKDGILDPVAIPIIQTVIRDQAALQVGVAPDPARGAVLAWVVDAQGNPLSGVAAQKPAGLGPFRDGFSTNQLDSGSTTRPLGLLAIFDLPAPTARLTLSVTPKSTVFDLPVRPGALTLSTLIFN